MSKAIPSQGRLASWMRLFGVAGLVVLADQISKAIVEHNLVLGERSDLIPGVDVTRILNEGVAFGFLGGRGVGGVLVVTAIALVLVLGWFASGPRSAGISIAVGLVVGGAVGNLIDRIRQDAVTDFISLPLWPTFNIADVAITFGVIGLVFGALFAAESK